jgi:hypothetical protein
MSQIRFQRGRISVIKMDEWSGYRRKSVGWMNDPPAFIHPRIMFGPGLYLDPAFVEKHRITHVMNCAGPEDSPSWFREKHPMKYIMLGAPDSIHANILEWYPVFEHGIRQFIAESGSKTIYIHCQCGINRSGFLAVLYACKRLGYAYADVINSVLTQRPCALTNPTYKRQVQNAVV